MEEHNQFKLEIDGEREPPFNVLPHGGESIYYGVLLDSSESDSHYDYLLNEISWKNDEAVMFGKHITTARKVAWFGDRNFDYTYSGRTRTALEWTPRLKAMKDLIENKTGARYNSCLLNLYADGDQGMGWHHDDEGGLGPNSNIASISFGAVRRFDFRHKQSKEKVSVMLEHGSLLVMRGTTQACWQHQIPKSKKVTTPRINLTFRLMVDQ